MQTNKNVLLGLIEQLAVPAHQTILLILHNSATWTEEERIKQYAAADPDQPVSNDRAAEVLQKLAKLYLIEQKGTVWGLTMLGRTLLSTIDEAIARWKGIYGQAYSRLESDFAKGEF